VVRPLRRLDGGMKVAVSGSHSTGKSSLIAALLQRLPGYAHEPEAFDALADEVPLTPSEGPSLEGLEALLQHTIEAVAQHPPGSRVLFERSPVDYLAYAMASHDAPTAASADGFLETYRPEVRASVRNLDLIAYLPVSPDGPFSARQGEDEGFRSRVDEMLRRALLDDDYDLFGDGSPPDVVELAPDPRLQLSELLRRIETAESG